MKGNGVKSENRLESVFGKIGWKQVIVRRCPAPSGYGQPGSGYVMFSPDSKFCIYAGWDWGTPAVDRPGGEIARLAEDDLLLPAEMTRHAEWLFKEEGWPEGVTVFDQGEDSTMEYETVTGEFVPDGGFASLDEIALSLVAKGIFKAEED